MQRGEQAIDLFTMIALLAFHSTKKKLFPLHHCITDTVSNLRRQAEGSFVGCQLNKAKTEFFNPAQDVVVAIVQLARLRLARYSKLKSSFTIEILTLDERKKKSVIFFLRRFSPYRTL